MTMATDEEIDRFVADNRELIERMMHTQKEGIQAASEIGKEMTTTAIESTIMAADIVRKQSEEFVKSTYRTITNPIVQRHFMNAGLEFIAGLSALAEAAPMPGVMKDTARDFERNLKSAACRANKDCPAKVKAAPAEEKPAEEPAGDDSKIKINPAPEGASAQ